MKLILISLAFLVSLQVAAETDWAQNSILVESDSEVQSMIDAAVIELFQSSVRTTLCGAYKNSYSVYHSLGVSPAAAKSAFTGCQEVTSRPTKPLRKRYYLSFSQNSSLDSWTDYGNRTYIFAGDGLTMTHLKAILLHEISISLDAKNNLLYSVYIHYLAETENPGRRGPIVINMHSLTLEQDTLRRAFNSTRWKPLSLSFAALRAFNFELLANNRPLMADHKICASSVRAMIQRMKSLPAAPQSFAVDAIVNFSASLINGEETPTSAEQEEALLEHLLSQNLTLKNLNGRQETFCQFMTSPLLTSSSLYSHYGSGPRPRVTGGSGGQGDVAAPLLQDSPWLQNLPEVKTLRSNAPLSAQDMRLQNGLEQIKRLNPQTTMPLINQKPMLRWQENQDGQ